MFPLATALTETLVWFPAPMSCSSQLFEASWDPMPSCYRLFLGRPNTHLLTPEKEPSTDQRNSSTNAWLLNQWLLLGVIGLLTGAEMTQTATSPRSTLAQVTAHDEGEPGAHSTAHRQCHKLQSVLSRCLSWSDHLLSGRWAGLKNFHCSLAGRRVTLSSLYCLLLGGTTYWIWSVSGTS